METVIAKIYEYGFHHTKRGDYVPKIVFKYETETGQKFVSYYGNLSPGNPLKYTLQTLLICGFTGSDINQISLGKGSNVLDEEKDIELVLTPEVYEDKTHMKIKYINDPNMRKSKFSELAKKLPDYANEFEKVRKELGLSVDDINFV